MASAPGWASSAGRAVGDVVAPVACGKFGRTGARSPATSPTSPPRRPGEGVLGRRESRCPEDAARRVLRASPGLRVGPPVGLLEKNWRTQNILQGTYRDLRSGVTRRSEVDPGKWSGSPASSAGACSILEGYRRTRNVHGEVSVFTALVLQALAALNRLAIRPATPAPG